MKLIKSILILFIVLDNFNACLVPPSPRNHYFIPADSLKKNNPTIRIFSTPKTKNYVVTNVDRKAQVFIKSPIFVNPDEFYLMKKKDSYGTEALQFELYKNDRKFYKTVDYKNITLKIIYDANEKMINYKMIKN